MTWIRLADFGRLARARGRTRVVRIGLAVVLAALVTGIAIASAHPKGRTLRFLPHGTTRIVVLDLSASISTDTYQRIGTTLRELAGTNGRYGLVVFSDVAYQALPPGTPAAELKPYARYFTLSPARNGFLPQFPANPWTNSFSGGTRIAAGLGLALRIIQDGRVKSAGVILVSDLDDDPGDLKNLAGVALAYRHASIPVRVVALNPQPRDQALFERLLERAVTVEPARLPGEQARTTGAAVPPVLAALIAFVVLGLAVNELWSARLTWESA